MALANPATGAVSAYVTRLMGRHDRANLLADALAAALPSGAEQVQE
jgi:hypothetical protein